MTPEPNYRVVGMGTERTLDRAPGASALDIAGKVPPSARGRRTRASLIKAAREVFERDGFTDSRIVDITTLANNSVGTFYTYFEDKEEILKVVLAEALDEVLERALWAKDARAADKPDLEVDRIPSPITMKPAALQKVPPTALRKDGSAVVKVDVVIDTLGKADMKTFKVVSVSHPWFATNVRSVIGKWTFSPAELAGCKVPRVYHFMANTKAPAAKKGK